ncbi:DUF5134 domain-containing protein [Streptomyces sp. NPDC101393]|uniref:DUF5134 domain-containing protein n=1 Tax=Streptomyces sp. NPDC101393 TaxID=3366141 RepID=UPI003810A832
MHGPPWVGWLLVLLCVATGGYCLSRVRTGTVAQRVEARGEALMGLGMAVMAVPSSAVPMPPWSAWAFAGVFGAAGLWALAHRHPHHLVGSAAMVHMALAMAAMTAVPAAASAGPAGHAAHSGHTGTGGLPLLTGLLLAYYTVFVLVAGIRLVPAGPVRAAGSGPAGALAAGRGVRREVLGACRVAMGIGMFAMLLTL